MKKSNHNLKLITPLKENELFSIKKYQKKPQNTTSNSFFSTQYSVFNNMKYFLKSFNKTKKFGSSLNETSTKYNTKYNTKDNFNNNNNNKLLQIPYPSFPQKKKTPLLYKNSIKLVKYPKIQRDNFTIYNYQKSTHKKTQDKLYNTFSESKINAETQTYPSKINDDYFLDDINRFKTHYKGNIHKNNLNLSPIKKKQKEKYIYKPYNYENINNIKNEIKKKLKINDFNNILDNMIRLIEMRDEHNKDITYIKVTNLLLDEMSKLIEIRNKKKPKKRKKKKYKSVATSTNQKIIQNKILDLENDKEFLKTLRKKVRYNTFIPPMENMQIKYSFNPETVNKVEDEKSFNNKKSKNADDYFNNYENKNYFFKKRYENNISEVDDESETSKHIMKSKYNNSGGSPNKKRRNINSDFNINDKNKNYIFNNNNNNGINDSNNTNDNQYSDFGIRNSFNLNNFISMKNHKNKAKIKSTNVNNKSIPEKFDISNLLGDISTKIENNSKSKKILDKNKEVQENENENEQNSEQINEVKKSSSKNLSSKNLTEIIELNDIEKYIKNEKLINLIKEYSKLENIEEENSNDEKNENIEEDQDLNDNDDSKNNNDQNLDTNTIDEYINDNDTTIKRRKRKANTNMLRKKIDLGFEIIKNIFNEINLNKKEKEEIFNSFEKIKIILNNQNIANNEYVIHKKTLKTINDFIKNYLIDLQKLNLTKSNPKMPLSKYFKINLSDKLNDILDLENNTIEKLEKPHKKKAKKKPKSIPKKKLIYDNSYFFKSNKKKEIPLKLDISLKEDSSIEEKSKSALYSPEPASIRKRKSKFVKSTFRKRKRGSGLKQLISNGKIALTEEQKRIEKENLLDRRLKAFFEEIKILKNIKDNNMDKLNLFIDKEIEKSDIVKNKAIETRKYNFYEELKINRVKSKKEKKWYENQRFLSYQSPLIFNMHKEEDNI